MTTPPYSTFFPLLPSDVVEIQSQLLSEVRIPLFVFMRVIITLPVQGETDCVLENLTQVDFDMLTHQYQTSIKVGAL
jgi:hypothetical protein